jgi:hypothetical protein
VEGRIGKLVGSLAACRRPSLIGYGGDFRPQSVPQGLELAAERLVFDGGHDFLLHVAFEKRVALRVQNSCRRQQRNQRISRYNESVRERFALLDQ